MACVEVAQQSGKIAMNAMLRVGIAVQSAQTLMDKMEPSDVLIVFTPEKKKRLGARWIGGTITKATRERIRRHKAK